MKKFFINILIVVLTITMFVACKKKDEEIEYNSVEGVANGTVELAGEEPKISISNIKAKVGTDIDYLSGVVVEDEDKFEDFEVWVDASAVDIDEPGNYKAKYTFKYDGNSLTHEIIVTIVADETEASAEEGNQVAQNNTNDNNGGSQTEQSTTNPQNISETVNNEAQQATSNEGGVAGSQGEEGQQGGTSQQTTTKSQGSNNQQTTTKSQNTSTQQTTTKKQSTSTQQTTTKTQATTTKTQSGASQTTSRREMITSSGNSTTEVQNIGYSYIELLSGSTVSIKSTTAKYIVSTRTDVSYTTKNGVKYKVSKLIITYNTGDERTLETVEEKCNQ